MSTHSNGIFAGQESFEKLTMDIYKSNRLNIKSHSVKYQVEYFRKGKMNVISYMLEVYKPNSESETACSFIAATPFPTISKGEGIKFFSDLDGAEWLVTKVVHLLWEVENKVTFKTLVFTE